MNIDTEINNSTELLKQLPANEQDAVRQYIDFLLDCKHREIDKWSLRELRQNTVVTQERLAELTGISASTISRVERGFVNPEVKRKLWLFLMACRIDKETWLNKLFKSIDLKSKL
ncbi:helix-turn-helix domain-containing protein [Chloroflexota bacterium]